MIGLASGRLNDGGSGRVRWFNVCEDCSAPYVRRQGPNGKVGPTLILQNPDPPW